MCSLTTDMWNTLSGAELGSVDVTPMATLGRTNAEATVWTSDSAVYASATVPVGGRSRAAQITVAVQVGTRSASASYDTPVLVGVGTSLLLSPIACEAVSNTTCAVCRGAARPVHACACCALHTNRSVLAAAFAGTVLSSNSSQTLGEAINASVSQEQQLVQVSAAAVALGDVVAGDSVLQVRRDTLYRVFVPPPELESLSLANATRSAAETLASFLINDQSRTSTHASAEGTGGDEGGPGGGAEQDTINTTAFCARACRRNTHMGPQHPNASSSSSNTTAGDASSSATNALRSWVGINGSTDAETSALCQTLCGRPGHVQTEPRETVSCFAMAYYSGNQPCSLTPSRSALIFGQAFSQVRDRMCSLTVVCVLLL